MTHIKRLIEGLVTMFVLVGALFFAVAIGIAVGKHPVVGSVSILLVLGYVIGWAREEIKRS